MDGWSWNTSSHWGFYFSALRFPAAPRPLFKKIIMGWRAGVWPRPMSRFFHAKQMNDIKPCRRERSIGSSFPVSILMQSRTTRRKVFGKYFKQNEEREKTRIKEHVGLWCIKKERILRMFAALYRSWCTHKVWMAGPDVVLLERKSLFIVERRKWLYTAMFHFSPLQGAAAGWLNYNIIVQLFLRTFRAPVRRWFAIDDFVLFKYDDMK